MALPALSRRSKQFVASFTDAAMLMACLWLAVALRYGDVVPDVSTFYWVFPLPALVALPLFHRAGLYRAVNRYIGSATLFAGVRALAITALVLAAVIYFRRPFEFPRSAPPIFFLIATLYLLGSRYLLNRMAAATRARVARTAVLIYGTDEGAIRLADLLRDAGPYAVRGFADHRGAFQGGVLRDLPVLAPAQLPRFVAEQRIEAVLLTYTRARSDDRARALEVLGPLGVHVRAVPALGEIVSGMVRIEDLEQVDITDLLGRDVVSADPALIAARTRDRVVLVTGAAGSIGSELARQILMQRPRSLVLLDRHEHGLYELERELSALEGALDMSHRHTVVLMDVTDEQQLARLVAGFGVEVLFHAAAYKHVPLVEQNVATGVRNNVFGTLAVARAATAAGVQNMVLISTDKAVRPRSIMGASKRVAEICLQALAREPALAGSTVFSMVRFGNVLRSSGSVVPKFEQQIREGGPVTVTHPDVTRFFMSVEEAAQLVIQSAAMAEPGGAAWERVAEASGLTAGLIGGLGGARCRTVAAHAVHNGLTQLEASHGRLHGEKVGFGVLVQLRLEEQIGGNQLAAQARRQLLPFFGALALPRSLPDLGLGGATLEELQQVCAFACREGSDLHHLPFPVGPADLLGALVTTTAERQPA